MTSIQSPRSVPKIWGPRGQLNAGIEVMGKNAKPYKYRTIVLTIAGLECRFTRRYWAKEK